MQEQSREYKKVENTKWVVWLKKSLKSQKGISSSLLFWCRCSSLNSGVTILTLDINQKVTRIQGYQRTPYCRQASSWDRHHTKSRESGRWQYSAHSFWDHGCRRSTRSARWTWVRRWVPDEEGGAHGQEVDDDDAVGVDAAVVVVHGVDEDAGEETDFEADGKCVDHQAEQTQKVQKVNTAPLEWTAFHWWADVNTA